MEFPGKQRGAPKKAETVQREETLEEYRDKILINGRILPSKDIIYEELAAKFDVEPQVMYLLAKRLFKQQPIYKAEIDDESVYCEDEDYDMQFSLDIEGDEFIQNYTESAAYLRGIRSYLRDIIQRVSVYPCCWHFTLFSSRENEIIVRGRCTEKCKAKVFLTTAKSRKVLNVTLKDFNPNTKHTRKSYTTGAHKERIEELLMKNTAYVTRALLAADTHNDNDYESSLLPTASSLRQQKYRMKLLEAVTYLHVDPVLALVQMIKEPDFRHTIHEVKINPFVCLYSTPTQAALVKAQKRGTRIVFSMDATGVSVRLSDLASISERTGKLKKCFLYVITLQTPSGSAPIYQMLSQDQSTIQITTMLKKCDVQNNHKKKEEVIIDRSAALLLSVIETYTPFKSVHQYLDHCFDIMWNEDDSGKVTYVRHDRSHTTKEICHKQEFNKGMNKTTAMFYKRLLGYLIQEKSVAVCESIIRQLFTVLNNRYLCSADVCDAVKMLEKVSLEHKFDEQPKIEDGNAMQYK